MRSTDKTSRLLKKIGMLREPQHERKILSDISYRPFVLSSVDGLREGFQQSARNSKLEIRGNSDKAKIASINTHANFR